MNKRPSKSRLSGDRFTPPPVRPGGGKITSLIKQNLANEAAWGYFALNGKWICPFCLASVNRRSGRSREDSIATHLETCRGFSNGNGQLQQIEIIVRRQQYENLVHLADTDPAWRVYDQTGSWYCPACLDRIPTVRVQGGQLTSFIYQAMSEHLGRCGSYLRGVRPSPEDVQRARDRAMRFPALLQTVTQNLQFPSWRYIDPMGLWVCPCCLKHIPRVRVSRETDWQRAPEHITHHLLLECSSYMTNPNAVHAEAEVRAEASSAAPVIQSNSGQQNSLGSGPAPIGNRTPISASGAHSISSPTGMQRLTPPGTRFTPPVAKPIVGGQQMTPPGTRSVNPPTGANPIGRRVDGTPTSGAPANANPNTARWTPPRNILNPPSTATPVPPPVIVSPKNPNKDDTLFGNLKSGFLDDTPLGRLDEQKSESGETGQGLNWMDEAENTSPATTEPDTPTPERSDMLKARAVQQGLMQKPPEIPGFSFSASFEACSDISGDFYQFISFPDGRVGFALGDVSGHGVQAGLIMSMAKKTFEIYASMGISPAETLSKVNDAIANDLGGNLFISMVYALLDPSERTITWARAGHNPSIRYNPDDGEIEEIKPPGMVVGMKTGPIFRNSIQEQVTKVRSGDVILLYTDGITETMNLQQEEFETERLFDVIKKFSGDGPDILVNRIMEILRHFRGPQPPSDDSTLLALCVE